MANPDKPNLASGFKNIDTAKFTEAMTEHQNSLIKLVLIVGTLVLAGLIFNDFRLKDQHWRLQMTQAQEKLDIIKAHEAALKGLNDFRSALPQRLNESELISLISNYATAHGVNIGSLSPAQSRDMGLYDVITIKFNATCNSFREMMLFLKNVERSGYPLRIDMWSGNESVDGKINFVIEISAVLIHP